MRILTRQNMEDYILGATVLGCGGGGSPEAGMRMVNDAFNRGLEFSLMNLAEAPDGLLCIVGSVGGGVSDETKKRLAPYFARFVESVETMPGSISQRQTAARELSNVVGESFYSYVATETGPLNGIIPMYLAALEGKPCIDGDCCGRAKPEIAISTTHVAGISITPLVIVTPFDEVMVLKSAVDDYRAEDICRHVAIVSGGGVTVARCPARKKEYLKGIMQGQVTKCIELGEAIRKARNEHRDPVKAIIEKTNAYFLFNGIVGSYEDIAEGAFNYGNWVIKGLGRFSGHVFRVWFKNENLISWLDGKIYVTCPDLICVVDRRTGIGLQNMVKTGIYNGSEVVVLGIKAPELWRTSKGIEIFGPRHFGYDLEYVPLEEHVNSQKL